MPHNVNSDDSDERRSRTKTLARIDFNMSLPPPSYNDNPKSFAYETVRQRWPKIIEGAIDDLTSLKSQRPNAADCAASVLQKLRQLLVDFKADKEILEFTADEIELKEELKDYNAELKLLKSRRSITWLTGPWLFLECYLYQLFNVWFRQTKKLKDYDMFNNSKIDAFKQSSDGVVELCKRMEKLADELGNTNVNEDILNLLFVEFTDISLWGNATDLSLLAGNASLEELKSVQGAEVRKKNEDKIIVNNIQQAWKHLRNSQNSRLDIVLDNSGFELFADLSLSLFLLEAGLVENVVLHCKDIPWFVSDTMPKDFKNLLEHLDDPGFFPHVQTTDYHFIESFSKKVKKFVDEKKLVATSHKFWTSFESYWEIPHHQDLYEDLLRSDLIIFKGDLNYRKLTNDLTWKKTTPFVEAIQGLASSKLPILTLRTCKADVVVGLPEGLNEQLTESYKLQGNQNGELWTASGKWAVMSFSDGKA